METPSSPLVAVLQIISDENLRNLVSLSLLEQRRRAGLTVARCKNRAKEALDLIPSQK